MKDRTMVFHEETLNSERIYEGKILNLRKDEVRVKSGKKHSIKRT